MTRRTVATAVTLAAVMAPGCTRSPAPMPHSQSTASTQATGGGVYEPSVPASPAVSDCPSLSTASFVAFMVGDKSLRFVTSAGSEVGSIKLTDFVTVATLGRVAYLLYDAGTLVRLSTRTCRGDARLQILPAHYGAPAGTDQLYDGIVADSANGLWVYGRYSPPGQELYGGFVYQVDANMRPARHFRYTQPVQDVDPAGGVVLLYDGTVHDLTTGKRLAARRATTESESVMHVARDQTGGVWIASGINGPSTLQRPDGSTVALPEAAAPAELVPLAGGVAVLTGRPAEVWLVPRASGQRIVRMKTPSPPVAAALDEGRLYVACPNADAVTVIDVSARKVLTTVTLRSEPVAVAPLR